MALQGCPHPLTFNTIGSFLGGCSYAVVIGSEIYMYIFFFFRFGTEHSSGFRIKVCLGHSDLLPQAGVGIAGGEGAAVVGQWGRDVVVVVRVWGQDLGVHLLYLDFVYAATLGAALTWPV